MDFKNEIANAIAPIINETGLTNEDVLNLIEIPADVTNGDYAFPCFRLAKSLHKSPVQIASDLSEKINKPDCIEKIEPVNAYLNFFVNKISLISHVLKMVITEKENYGKCKIGAGKTIVIDYSSPNIAKPFHVGHLRSTVIGNALYNIFSSLGYKCIGVNHLGDWGTQFGKLITAYKLWGDKEAVEKDDIKELSRIYVKFHEEAEKDDSLNDTARSWLVKMQEGDEEALSLWKWFCDISMREFERIYKRLNIKFDYYTGESFYNDKMAAVVEDIRNKGLLKESKGAQIVDLTEYNMPPCLILRSDGGTLYPTRDISAAIYRKKEYDFHKCLYLTALDQNLHFAQWFKVVELMGYDWYKNLVHIPFGLVSLGDGKLSTRKGHVVLMEDILNSAVEKTSGIIETKNSSLPNKKEISEQVGIGAVVFNDLFNSRIKNVVFDLNRMLNFEGETGPYVQYTHARACSILRKEGITDIDPNTVDYSLLNNDSSFEVCKILSEYNSKLIDAAEKYEPYILTRFLVSLCQSFNIFYNENNIKNAEGELKKARIAIVIAVKTAISSALAILGIAAPEQM